jgi:hypothetical protein
MPRRELVTVALLTFFTCGLYSFYWHYQTTNELKAVTGKDLNAGIELLLTLATCGFFGFYIQYRNAQLVTEQLRAWKGSHEDKSTLVLILDVSSLFVGVTWFIAVLILQDELNRLADAAAGVRPIDAQRVG